MQSRSFARVSSFGSPMAHTPAIIMDDELYSLSAPLSAFAPRIVLELGRARGPAET